MKTNMLFSKLAPRRRVVGVPIPRELRRDSGHVLGVWLGNLGEVPHSNIAKLAHHLISKITPIAFQRQIRVHERLNHA
jgi:hypothetical protein